MYVNSWNRMNKVVVIIPLYKKNPDDAEIKSLKQCLHILSKKPIVFFAGYNFDTTSYEALCDGKITFQVEKFEDRFFNSVKDYNQLLLSKQFYQRFTEYEYIFIYQLDAYVFRDELNYWCDQNYDNIGAPWFVGFDKPVKPLVFLGSGNGGCTLRKVSSCIRVLTTFRYIENPLKKFLKDKSFKNLIKNLTVQNNFYHRFNKYKLNEDYFFSNVVPEKFKWFKNCPPENALRFSFETEPAYLFGLNNNHLPMCCHAWEKYDYEFWKPFIEIASGGMNSNFLKTGD